MITPRNHVLRSELAFSCQGQLIFLETRSNRCKRKKISNLSIIYLIHILLILTVYNFFNQNQLSRTNQGQLIFLETISNCWKTNILLGVYIWKINLFYFSSSSCMISWCGQVERLTRHRLQIFVLDFLFRINWCGLRLDFHFSLFIAYELCFLKFMK